MQIKICYTVKLKDDLVRDARLQLDEHLIIDIGTGMPPTQKEIANLVEADARKKLWMIRTQEHCRLTITDLRRLDW